MPGEFGDRFTDVSAAGAARLCAHSDARDTVLARPVRLVVPTAAGGRLASDCIAFQAEILSALAGHPYVVALHERIVLPDGRPALVLDHLAGSLADLSGRYPASVRTAVSLAIRLCAALDAVHAAGALHTDVRPATVAVTPSGEPVVTAFDEAVRRRVGGTPTRAVEAPAPHTAPELILGAPLSEATDVYGIGMTLFELLAGHPAYPTHPAEAPAQLSRRIVQGARTSLRPDVPADVADLLGWALAPDPAERAPGPAWLAEGLRHVERSQGWARTPRVSVALMARR
jgi:serine/threonine protein kinase